MLRRIMRRALLQGHRIGIEHGFLPQYVEPRHRLDGRRLSGAAGPARDDRQVGDAPRRRASGARSSRARGCSTTCWPPARSRAPTPSACTTPTASRSSSRARSPPSAACPFAGEAEFERLMGEQRARSRRTGAPRRWPARSTRRGRPDDLHRLRAPRGAHDGHRPERARTGARIVKLAESPFYAEGGGQVSDGGVIACEDGDCLVRVADVVRAGDDQAIVVETVDGQLQAGERVVARVDRAARNATAGQPHRDAPAPRRAAQPPRAARPPGGLLRGTRQAALRLLPHAAPERGGAPRRRGPGQRRGSCATTPCAR